MSKVAVQSISPEWIAALRLLVGAAVLQTIAVASRQLPGFSTRKWGKYAWLGIIGNTAPFFLITWGIQHVTSGVSGLLMGIIPILIFGLAHFFLPGERLNWHRTAGLFLGFAGLIVLLDPRTLLSFKVTGDALWGELAIIAGCLCYAAHSITAKRMGFDKPFAQSSAVLICGALASVLLAFVLSPQGLSAATPLGLWATLGLGLIPTGFATIIMYVLMDRTSPTMVAQSNYLVPVYALLFGAITLGEHIEWTVWMALALIMAGIFVGQMRRGGQLT